ncbi:MAG: hypothetical protein ACYC6C_00925 [Coriobacteriia bacterium]
MCEHGVNTDQLRLMIAQLDDALGVSQHHVEQIHHLADHAGLHDPSVNVAQASVLLGEARSKLEMALNALEALSDGDGVTVELL